MKFGTTYTIAVISFLIVIFSKKRDNNGLIYLLFLTMIYNTILKDVFKLPLPETCPSKGFGFPSGHMNFNAIFYFWLMMINRNAIIRAALLSMLGISGWGMVYSGFHYARDVLITPLFAFALIFLYKRYIEILGKEKAFAIVLAISMILLVVVSEMRGIVEFHIALAYGIILGFGSVFLILLKNRLKLATKILMILGMVLIFCFWDEKHQLTVYHILEKIKWILVGGAAPFLKALLNRCYKATDTVE